MMLTRHHGVWILLLFSVVGHATLVDSWFGRQGPLWQLGFALILAPILLVLLGEWVADDAFSPWWQRIGWGMAVLGAAWHLVLDAACLILLPLWGAPQWQMGVAGSVVGAVVMALVLRRAWRGFLDPDAPESDPAVAPAQESALGRLWREAALVGGTAITLLLVSLGLVALAVLGLLRHPERLGTLLWAGGLFALCAVVAVWMGLDRRALLLGQPSPFARLLPRWRRPAVHAVKEGLVLLDRRGATLYPWDAIAKVWVGMQFHNPAVFIDLAEDATVVRLPLPGRPAPDPQSRARREARNRQLLRALTGCDLAIMGTLTAEGPGVLARQIEEALADDSARESLPSVRTVLADREQGHSARSRRTT